jgi:hypothetical protein
MRDIDLIPIEFRAWTLFLRRVKVFGIFTLLLMFVIVASYVVLKQQKDEAHARVDALQNRKDISTRQRNELQKLITVKEDLQNQLTLLSGLRAGSSAMEMFQAIDQAIIDEQLWFLSWKYRRAGSVVKASEQTKNTGYFIVLPKGEKTAETEAWQIKTHMTIRGEALDHSALSDFVMRLINQPQISDVRVLNTISKRRDDVRLVGFELAVTVAGRAGNS